MKGKQLIINNCHDCRHFYKHRLTKFILFKKYDIMGCKLLGKCYVDSPGNLDFFRLYEECPLPEGRLE